MLALLGVALVVLLGAMILWPHARPIPTPDREPVDLGPALRTLARDGRGIDPRHHRQPVSEDAHVRVLGPHDRFVYDWRRDGE